MYDKIKALYDLQDKTCHVIEWNFPFQLAARSTGDDELPFHSKLEFQINTIRNAGNIDCFK